MLQKIFGDLKTAYATPFANKKNRSGFHAPDFWNYYCGGNKEVLYLHEQISAKNCVDLHTMFATTLPEGVMMASDDQVVLVPPSTHGSEQAIFQEKECLH
jgi:hypothetical protein